MPLPPVSVAENVNAAELAPLGLEGWPVIATTGLVLSTLTVYDGGADEAVDVGAGGREGERALAARRGGRRAVGRVDRGPGAWTSARSPRRRWCSSRWRSRRAPASGRQPVRSTMTVTVKSWVVVLPAVSVEVQVTVGLADRERGARGGRQDTGSVPSTASVAVGASQVAAAPDGPAAGIVWSAGAVKSGPIVSRTVTLKWVWVGVVPRLVDGVAVDRGLAEREQAARGRDARRRSGAVDRVARRGRRVSHGRAVGARGLGGHVGVRRDHRGGRVSDRDGEVGWVGLVAGLVAGLAGDGRVAEREQAAGGWVARGDPWTVHRVARRRRRVRHVRPGLARGLSRQVGVGVDDRWRFVGRAVRDRDREVVAGRVAGLVGRGAGDRRLADRERRARSGQRTTRGRCRPPRRWRSGSSRSRQRPWARRGDRLVGRGGEHGRGRVADGDRERMRGRVVRLVRRGARDRVRPQAGTSSRTPAGSPLDRSRRPRRWPSGCPRWPPRRTAPSPRASGRPGR